MSTLRERLEEFARHDEANAKTTAPLGVRFYEARAKTLREAAAALERAEALEGEAEAYQSMMEALEVALDGDTMYGNDPAELIYRLWDTPPRDAGLATPRTSGHRGGGG